MQVRFYREGKWNHIMLDDDAWDKLGKFVSGMFEAMSAQMRPVTPLQAVPASRESFLTGLKVGEDLTKEIRDKQIEEKAKKEEAAKGKTGES